MNPLDTQLRSAIPTHVPPLDHDQLQQRGRRRRLATRAVTGSAATGVLAAVVVLATSMSSPSPIAPIGPGSPTSSASSSTPTMPDTPVDQLRHAMEGSTPTDLEVTNLRHVRAVSSAVPAGEDVTEWSRVFVTDRRVQGIDVEIQHASATLREATTPAALRGVLADIASQQAPLGPDEQTRWLREGPVEATIGQFEGDHQLDDAIAATQAGQEITAAQRMGDAMLSLSAEPEGRYWRDLLDVLEQLEPVDVTTDIDLLGRDVTAFAFTSGIERLQLNFDPTSGRPAGIDMLVDTQETTEDGIPLLQREVVLIP